jgi:hypothetical protein
MRIPKANLASWVIIGQRPAQQTLDLAPLHPSPPGVQPILISLVQQLSAKIQDGTQFKAAVMWVRAIGRYCVYRMRLLSPKPAIK